VGGKRGAPASRFTKRRADFGSVSKKKTDPDPTPAGGEKKDTAREEKKRGNKDAKLSHYFEEKKRRSLSMLTPALEGRAYFNLHVLKRRA